MLFRSTSNSNAFHVRPFSLIHLLPWQLVIEAQKRLGDVMKVADLSTGRMENLMPPMSDQEEEMFRNMMRRLHTVFKVMPKVDKFYDKCLYE